MNQALHEQYLKWGRATLQYCQWTFVIGASNKNSDIERTGGWSSYSVSLLRAQGATSLDDLAEKAKAARCGNCGEQAAVAYQYLNQTFAARPLDYMVLNPQRKTGAIHNLSAGVCDGDHVFVVIGRTGGNPASYRTWDVEAVVCDPWAGVVCPAYEYGGKGVCGFAWHPTASWCRIS